MCVKPSIPPVPIPRWAVGATEGWGVGWWWSGFGVVSVLLTALVVVDGMEEEVERRSKLALAPLARNSWRSRRTRAANSAVAWAAEAFSSGAGEEGREGMVLELGLVRAVWRGVMRLLNLEIAFIWRGDQRVVVGEVVR